MSDYERDHEGRWKKRPSGLIVPSTFGAHLFLAGPLSGADATPTPRAIDSSDLPEATDVAVGGIALAEDLDGIAAAPQVRQARGLRSSGGTRYPIGSLSEGRYLKIVDGQVVAAFGTTSGSAQQPLGHDISALPSAKSHWPLLDTILGGTSIPDVLGAHDITTTNTLRSVGRLWYSSEGQVWLSAASVQSVGNVASLVAEARDASCYFMGWIFVAGEVNATWRLFAIPQSGTGSGANTPYSLYLDSPNSRLTLAWQHSSNTTVTTVAEIAPGLHHVCGMREHSTTSTATIVIDGEIAATASGLTNPSGGGSLTVARLAHSASPTGEANHAVLGDCVWGSGGLPTLAQIRTQYRRGMGSY